MGRWSVKIIFYIIDKKFVYYYEIAPTEQTVIRFLCPDQGGPKMTEVRVKEQIIIIIIIIIIRPKGHLLDFDSAPCMSLLWVMVWAFCVDGVVDLSVYSGRTRRCLRTVKRTSNLLLLLLHQIHVSRTSEFK